MKNSSDNTKRFLKYMSGGAVYFWVGYAVFAACYSVFKWDWFPAKIAADAVGWTLNYLVQRFWAFSDRIHLSEMQHAGRYIFIESIGFFISAVFFTAWSWLWYKYWVFPERAGRSASRNHYPLSKG